MVHSKFLKNDKRIAEKVTKQGNYLSDRRCGVSWGIMFELLDDAAVIAGAMLQTHGLSCKLLMMH